MKQIYSSVQSIGSQCLTSTMLQNAQLKEASGPFDWIFSSLGMVCDCIEDDFATFLDSSHYEQIPAERRASPDFDFCEHDVYRCRYGLNTIFVHSDPTVRENYGYLERCVDRFRVALRSDPPSMLVGIIEATRGGRENFERLCALVDENGTASVLVITIDSAANIPVLTLEKTIGRHRLFRFNPMSDLDGIRFVDPADNMVLIDALKEMIALPERGPAESSS